MYKRHGGQYGKLAPRDALAFPWQEVHIDTIGSWRVNRRGLNQKYTAVTMIDPVTDLLEIRLLPMKNGTAIKNGKQCARALEHGWLCRYPKPVRIVHDGGPEFENPEFRAFLEQAGLQSKPISSGNLCYH